MRRLVIVNRDVPTPDPRNPVLLAASPATVAFGSVSPGSQSPPANITVRNRGVGETGPGTAPVEGRDASAFAVRTNGCAGGLGGGSACRIAVVFTPPAGGRHQAELLVPFAGGSDGPYEIRVPLDGAGGGAHSGPGANASARPTKGGAYVGTLTPSAGLDKRVVLKVSKAGDTGGARLQCADTRIGSFRRFKISRRGRFTAYRQTGSLVTARLRGRFASKTTARAYLYLPADCDGVGGRITLELK